MAVYETNNPSALKIKFDCGLNEEGKTITKSRTYSKLKHDAATQDVLDVANALIGLQIHSSLEVLKQDNTILN